MADRDAILDDSFSNDGMEDACREITTKPYKAVQSAMDEYMKSTCLELLDYMAKNNVNAYTAKNGISYFMYKGQSLTKDKLFENFL